MLFRLAEASKSLFFIPLVALVSSCETPNETEADKALVPSSAVPGDVFDLSRWSITIPLDADNSGRADNIFENELQTYVHPDFFFLNDDKHLVFASPNKATTTPNSSNTRSELHQRLRAGDMSIPGDSPKNNFALASHPNAAEFAQIGGKLEAKLKVNHVSIEAGKPEKAPAYSVVVGQIHAGKMEDKSEGFGWGNEPIKIYFKKFPDHQYGSVFWTYEINLPKLDPNRRDVAYPVWGNTWENHEAPGDRGIALDEEFSYVINVYEDTMYLTFETGRHETVNYEINLANNVDAFGRENEHDHPKGYAGDWHFFKAGAYNQCSTSDKEGFWYAACPGTGVWQEDKSAGHFAQVTFSKLIMGKADKPN